jgi:hypothetical protein
MPGSFRVLFVYFLCWLCCEEVSCEWCTETKTVTKGGRQLDRWKESLTSLYGARDRLENWQWREGRRETGRRSGEEIPTERAIERDLREREAGRPEEGREPDSKETASDNGER